jgi:SMI1/KNR4 family protein SUKH-1
MADPVQLLQQAQQEKFQSRRGRPLRFELMPPLSEKEISAFAAGLPGPLPPAIRRLLAFARGFTIEVDEDWPQDIEEFLVDFAGADESLPGAQDSLGALPHPAYIACDDAGNSWAVDVDGASGAWGAVMYICHDPAEMTIQSRDLAGFIADALDLGRSGRVSNIARICNGKAAGDRGQPQWAFTALEARTAADPALARFAGGLAENVRIYDLRALRPGMGFDWSPLMPDGRILRDNRNMIFAIEPRAQARGQLGRLVKRRA